MPCEDAPCCGCCGDDSPLDCCPCGDNHCQGECDDFSGPGPDYDDYDPDVEDDSMDGDHASALASAGLGTDEDYGDYGDFEGDGEF